VSELEQQSLWAQRLAERRNDYDVTNTVRVSSPSAVCAAVHEIFSSLYPRDSFKPMSRAFLDFQRLFNGEYPGYYGCDTVYHDIQHTLDMTLANARLIAGFEMSNPIRDQLGPRRAVVALVTSLFHDAGYIRRHDDDEFSNGAEVTSFHVSRSARFLENYMPQIGFADFAATAAQIVHFSGYEVRPEQIRVAEPKDRRLGHLLGTADLMAQMADRCYLEKCRDRLYPEFVLAGIAVEKDGHGNETVNYASGDDLLKKTDDFYRNSVRTRLENNFESVYEYANVLFDGTNPYLMAIEKNLAYLRQIASRGDGIGLALRRRPECFTWPEETLENVIALAEHRLVRKEASAAVR
jgi:hypothetical protein